MPKSITQHYPTYYLLVATKNINAFSYTNTLLKKKFYGDEYRRRQVKTTVSLLSKVPKRPADITRAVTSGNTSR
ncbi:MAG: hypothetical protein ACXWTK_00075 [Methylobacter sp.]